MKPQQPPSQIDPKLSGYLFREFTRLFQLLDTIESFSSMASVVGTTLWYGTGIKSVTTIPGPGTRITFEEDAPTSLKQSIFVQCPSNSPTTTHQVDTDVYTTNFVDVYVRSSVAGLVQAWPMYVARRIHDE